MKEEALKGPENHTSKINQMNSLKKKNPTWRSMFPRLLAAAPYLLSITGHQPPSAMTLSLIPRPAQVLLKSCVQLPVKPSWPLQVSDPFLTLRQPFCCWLIASLTSLYRFLFPSQFITARLLHDWSFLVYLKNLGLSESWLNLVPHLVEYLYKL